MRYRIDIACVLFRQTFLVTLDLLVMYRQVFIFFQEKKSYISAAEIVIA